MPLGTADRTTGVEWSMLMSNFYCVCGFNMKDSTDNLPYTAYFLPDEDVGHALTGLLLRVAAFIEARERGQQGSYVREALGISLAQHTLRDVLHNLFLHPTFEFGREMFECEECGRIWLRARPHKNEWVSYDPEGPRPTRDILSHEGVAPGE
jgi:hypothetical protein